MYCTHRWLCNVYTYVHMCCKYVLYVYTYVHMCCTHRWLCNKLVRRGRGQAPDAGEIPVHLRQVLEACFDKYDEFQRQSQLGGDEDEMGLARAAHEGLPPLCLQSTPEADGSHLQDAAQLRDLNDLAASKNGGMPSTVKNGYLCHLYPACVVASAVGELWHGSLRVGVGPCVLDYVQHCPGDASLILTLCAWCVHACMFAR